MYQPLPPDDLPELMQRCRHIAGLTLEDLASQLKIPVPARLRDNRGWAGLLIETALGAAASSKPVPDFDSLGIELKTLPINHAGRPLESTYVCSLPLRPLQTPRWEDCRLYRKLAQVLWLPILASAGLPLGQRRIGTALLWSPNQNEELLLRADWEEIMDLICLGEMAQISAHQGNCLQVRPKAANGAALRATTDPSGAPAQTIPRGFYLRTGFTETILQRLCGSDR